MKSWLMAVVITAMAVGVQAQDHGRDARATTSTVRMLEDAELQAKVEGLHRHLFSYFVHPETDLIYDMIAPPGSKEPWAHLPTPAEIKNKQPNVSGWGTGMEDCALNGGMLLAALVEREAIAGRGEDAADARRIFKGLCRLAAVGPRTGFIARAVTPDGKGFYANSSVDQYTNYVFGLWTYYHSRIASAAEKAQIHTIVGDICGRIEDDGFDILDAAGKPAQVSDIGVIRSDRSSRLLEIFRVGAEITGEAHLLEIYKEKAAENHCARLWDVATLSRVDVLPWGSRQAVYGILQNQVSLIPLLALERELPVRAAYLEAMRVNARIVEDRLFEFRKYTPAIHTDNYTLGGWRKGVEGRPGGMGKEFQFVRIPCEALVVLLLANDRYLVEAYKKGPAEELQDGFLRETCRELISTYDFEKMRTYCCLYAEYAYWLGVKQGLFQVKMQN